MGFYLAIVLVGGGAWYVATREWPYFIVSQDVPSQWQQMGIQVVSETSRLLTTLGSALLGGLALLLADKLFGSTKPNHLWSAFASGMTGVLSLFFGYAVHMRVLWLISLKAFDSTDATLVWLSHWEFYSLLAAAFFLADFAVHNIARSDST